MGIADGQRGHVGNSESVKLTAAADSCLVQLQAAAFPNLKIKKEKNSMKTETSNGNIDRQTLLDSVRYRFINESMREAADIPILVSKRIGDIEVGYRIELANDEKRVVSAIPTASAIEKLGITMEELDEAAMRNTAADGFTIMTMNQVLKEMGGIELEDIPGRANPYMITNRSRIGGATVMLVPEIMEKVREMLGDGFIILPSSVHEILVLPDDSSTPPIDELYRTVAHVNNSAVAPKDRLSGMVFRYDGRVKEVVVAERTEQKAMG